jgi:Ca2+-binding RTX toxin-like protein
VNAGNGSGTDLDAGSINFRNIKTFIGGTGGSEFTANSSDATAYTFKGGSGTNTLNGGAGTDTLVAGSENDTLNGGSGYDTLDFRTNSISLTNVKANGGDGNDTVIINQDKLATTMQLFGDAGSDILQFHASTAGEINLTNILDANKLNALKSFESLDFSKDNIASKAVISSSVIQGLVDGGNNSNLTLVLSKTNGAVDSYTIAAGENYSIGQNANSQTVFTFQNPSNVQIAQLTISYV